MKKRIPFLRSLLLVIALFVSTWTPIILCGQAVPYARTFPKTKEEVEGLLKEIQAYAGQKLPIVDGFVAVGDQPLSRYERAFYQFSIELVPDGASATIVRLTAKITAWYADRDPSKSGYQVLPSNGRLELDLLDRLSDRLGGKPLISVSRSSVLAPTPKLDLRTASSGTYVSSATSVSAGPAPVSGENEISTLRVKREAEEKHIQQLNAELQSLQEIQHNQARPGNLVAVRKSGTPILAKPAIGSRVLFTAAANDEFEFLDAQGEWIHVQISGESRGYVQRSGVELPELLAARSPNITASGHTQGAFRVAREETSVFPGNWDSLRGKTVKIYTVQPVSSQSRETRGTAKLDFAASLFRGFSNAPTGVADSIEGIVVIFDSADGGIVASNLSTAREFANGSLSTEGFWNKCYKDPSDAFR
jgi:hypothetical protein